MKIKLVRSVIGRPDNQVQTIRALGLKKIGEEATETVLAAKGGDRLHIVRETADLWFHCMILLARHGLGPADVLSELHRREVSCVDEPVHGHLRDTHEFGHLGDRQELHIREVVPVCHLTTIPLHGGLHFTLGRHGGRCPGDRSACRLVAEG